jgi:hypothetical protein
LAEFTATEATPEQLDNRPVVDGFDIRDNHFFGEKRIVKRLWIGFFYVIF